MYKQFKDENGEGYGSFEVFEVGDEHFEPTQLGYGWYWWACFPGCLPDGEAEGPFDTEAEAIADALELGS